MKNLLVVTYYWPPAGGVAVQRVLKLCKYLPNYGWRPVVLTVDGGNFEVEDPSVARDVAHVEAVRRVRALEPHALYRRLGGQGGGRGGGSGKTRFPALRHGFERFSEWLRGNLFIPDTRIGWYWPAVKAGQRLIRELNIDAIFSTAPPFTTHLVARRLHALSGRPWLADFRDPWLENAIYGRVPRSSWAMALNRRLEQGVLEQAGRVVCIGPGLANLLRTKLERRPSSHIAVVGNGYDRDDMLDVGTVPDRFYLSYFGSLYEERFPTAIYEAARSLAEDDEELRRHLVIRVFGNLTAAAEERLRRTVGAVTVEIRPPLPHRDYHRLLYEPQVLLLSIDRMPHNELIILGKTFDYLPTGNPILGVGPERGDAARILEEARAGTVVDYGDRERIKVLLDRLYLAWKVGDLNTGVRHLPQFERETKASQLAELLDTLVLGQGELNGSRTAPSGPRQAATCRK